MLFLRRAINTRGGEGGGRRRRALGEGKGRGGAWRERDWMVVVDCSMTVGCWAGGGGRSDRNGGGTSCRGWRLLGVLTWTHHTHTMRWNCTLCNVPEKHIHTRLRAADKHISQQITRKQGNYSIDRLTLSQILHIPWLNEKTKSAYEKKWEPRETRRLFV